MTDITSSIMRDRPKQTPLSVCCAAPVGADAGNQCYWCMKCGQACSITLSDHVQREDHFAVVDELTAARNEIARLRGIIAGNPAQLTDAGFRGMLGENGSPFEVDDERKRIVARYDALRFGVHDGQMSMGVEWRGKVLTWVKLDISWVDLDFAIGDMMHVPLLEGRVIMTLGGDYG